LESDLKDLKNDIDEIKNLLRRFVDGKAWRHKIRKFK
jgi:hypothetical protein